MHAARVAQTAWLAGLLAGLLAALPASAQQSIQDSIASRCASEISTYCKDVQPKDGRVAACLYAVEDKLSNTCAVHMYKGLVDLRTAIEAHGQCISDITRHCGDVAPGEGRLYQCLVSKMPTLEAACAAAVKKSEAEMRQLGFIK